MVTRKREEISNLLKRLMQQRNAEIDFLPEIPFPTLNGMFIIALTIDLVITE